MRLLGCVVLLFCLSAAGAQEVTGERFHCGDEDDSRVIWLFVLGTEGVCEEIRAGEFRCGGPGEAIAAASCARGCEQIIGGAGCFHAPRSEWKTAVATSLPKTPLLSLECEDGAIYDLSPREGGTCERFPLSGAAESGRCTSEDSDGAEVVDVRVDCRSGCAFEKYGARCHLRERPESEGGQGGPS